MNEQESRRLEERLSQLEAKVEALLGPLMFTRARKPCPSCAAIDPDPHDESCLHAKERCPKCDRPLVLMPARCRHCAHVVKDVFEMPDADAIADLHALGVALKAIRGGGDPTEDYDCGDPQCGRVRERTAAILKKLFANLHRNFDL